jgi:hypothetical protein
MVFHVTFSNILIILFLLNSNSMKNISTYTIKFGETL